MIQISLLIKYFLILILSLLLSIWLFVWWWDQNRQNQTSETFALSQEWLSPGEYCDKYQYASVKHQEIKSKITTILTKIITAFDNKYDAQTKINKYAVIIGKLNTKIATTNSKMVMYVANCAKDSFLQQILKNRSMLQEEDGLDEITQIFLDEYNWGTEDNTSHYAPSRPTLSTLPNGTGTSTTGSTTQSTPWGVFGNIYLNSSNASLGNAE